MEQTKLVQVQLENGVLVRVEATPITETGGLTPRSPDRPLPLRQVKEQIRVIATEIATAVEDVRQDVKANRCSVEFGLEFGLESGNLVAILGKLTSKTSLKVTLNWDESNK
ncbi:MAG: hypothetical protein KME42_20775 [Tildeniella nuda ZEHNDER 1965/U140]|jgi:hypothetical protein|nr:hypothetical protein [Tildeniella nuda ZEHNDER 1965/U140]